MTSESKETSKNGSGHLHAKLVDEAESVMRQFNLPVSSTTLIDQIVDRSLDPDSGSEQWNVYHQLVNVQRLQLESLFNCVLGFNDTAFAGLRGGSGPAPARSDILRSILLSLSSLMFLRMSTTITMATHGPHLQGPYPPGAMDAHLELVFNGARNKPGRRPRTPSRLPLDSAGLVNDEGLASLKADCELVSHLHNISAASHINK